MQTIWIACGPPASGKSTAIQERIQDNELYVSRDAVRLSMIPEGETIYSVYEDDVYHNFIEAVQNAINTGKNVYIDDTHCFAKNRKELLDNLDISEVDKINIICFKTSLFFCIKRNNKRDSWHRTNAQTVSREFYALQTEDPANDDFYKYDEIHYIYDDGTEEVKYKNDLGNK